MIAFDEPEKSHLTPNRGLSGGTKGTRSVKDKVEHISLGPHLVMLVNPGVQARDCRWRGRDQ